MAYQNSKTLATIEPRKLLPLVALAIVLLACIGLWSGLAAERYTPTGSDDGVWDLRGLDFSADTASLQGPVEHIPNALLTPQEFAAHEGEATLGFALTENQYATSRIRILVPDDRYYTLSRISTDFTDRIFVNGVPLTSVGTPGGSREASVPFTSRVTFTARPVDGMIEIVQQNSNFYHRDGDFPQDWHIGGYEYANTVLRMDYTVNIVLGCYLALFLIFLLLFFLLRGYRPNLYFALFCLMWFLRSGVTGTRAFAALVPWLSGPASLRMEYIAMPVAAILTLAIIGELFPGVLQKIFLRIMYGLSAAFVCLFLFLDTLYMSYAIVGLEALYLAVILYVLVRLAMKLRRPDTEQKVFIAGLLVFLYGGARDFFFYNDVHLLPPFAAVNLTQMAVLVFAFCEAAALFIATMKEVEDAKDAEQRLAAENVALDRVMRLRTEMMTTISHEARTPLAVLASYSSLVALEMREKGADAQTTADLDKIAHEAKRVAGLIDDMRRLPLQKDRERLRTDIDMGELVAQTSRLYRHILERVGVALETDIPDGLPPVYGNPEELTQVLFNLLQNAKEHIVDGRVSITVGSAERGGHPVSVSVCVADTGEGIAPELLPHVFERGARGSDGGTGIGLAVCKEIIEAHGGTIKVESEPGTGTAVTFALPTHTGGEADGT
jgi:signal transduction histidine kinase